MASPGWLSVRRRTPRLTSVWRPSGPTSHSREASTPNGPEVWSFARTGGRPISVYGVVTFSPRTTAVPGESWLSVCTHGSCPAATGSIATDTFGSPPAEVTVWGSALPKRTAPGCRAGQLGAVYGPPAGWSAGQVWLHAVTAPGAGGAPVPFRYASRNAEPWSLRCWSALSLLPPRWWPRSPTWKATGAFGSAARTAL